LQKLPGIWSGRRLVDVDVWNDGSTGEQSVFVRVVSFKIYPDRQPLYHLTKLPVAFCAGSNASVEPVPIVQLETLPLNTCRPPYVDIEIGGLTDAQVG
jgi:hypothetical protein